MTQHSALPRALPFALSLVLRLRYAEGMDNRYHCCATCVHIEHVEGTVFRCARLGYETKPRYRFHCWRPRPEIAARMAAEANARRRDE